MLVVPFATGGAADVIARLLSDPLARELRQPVVVQNRGGAGGLLGSVQVARAAADGHTLLLGGLAPQVIAPLINDNPGFDPIRDFTHIAYLGGPPICWVVNPATDIESIADVVDRARAGTLSGYASAGVGTLGHLVTELVIQRTGIKLAHIPYNTAALGDLIAGHVKLGAYTWGAVMGAAQSGTLRPIALSTERRLAGFPKLPTFKETGYDLVASTWFSLSAPAGLPREISAQLNGALARILRLPEISARLEQDAIEPTPMSPEQVTRFVEQEIERWRPVAAAAVKPR
ncbi:MAG: tripartite tricarboxylate transporter substrate binding protein [Hyphomicrobiales bacterium]|nr:tripartite tricarboxylate transporter substrate binding protein [Hyphomicrobiales bacterium]